MRADHTEAQGTSNLRAELYAAEARAAARRRGARRGWAAKLGEEDMTRSPDSIVADLAGVSVDEARRRLDEAGGDVRAALAGVRGR